MMLSFVGWSMILSHEGVFHSSSRVLGIDSDKFHYYVFTIVNLGFFFNVAVTATAMCTTGLCREKLFRGSSLRCCGKVFQCLMVRLSNSFSNSLHVNINIKNQQYSGSHRPVHLLPFRIGIYNHVLRRIHRKRGHTYDWPLRFGCMRN